MSDLESLRDQLRTFAAERDWDQFHSPKNLATALTVEASELLEHFQWLTEARRKRSMKCAQKLPTCCSKRQRGALYAMSLTHCHSAIRSPDCCQ